MRTLGGPGLPSLAKLISSQTRENGDGGRKRPVRGPQYQGESCEAADGGYGRVHGVLVRRHGVIFQASIVPSVFLTTQRISLFVKNLVSNLQCRVMSPCVMISPQWNVAGGLDLRFGHQRPRMNSGSKIENTLKRVRVVFQPVSTGFSYQPSNSFDDSWPHGRNENHSRLLTPISSFATSQ